MKTMISRLIFLAAFGGLAVWGPATLAVAAEERAAPPGRPERPEPRPGPMAQPPEQSMRPGGGQMERLEQRLNQIAERQEQFMRQIDARRERLGVRPQPGPEALRQPGPPQPGLRRPMPPGGAPPAADHAKALRDVVGLCVFLFLICNILMAIWIFTDIRKRGEGPAIFVAMALVAGIPAALIYALVRIGDKKPPTA